MRRGIELAPARDPRFTRASARASTAVTRAVHRRAPLRAPENAALRRIGVDLHRSALFRLKDASRHRNRRTLSPAWPRRSLQTAARGVGAGATRHAVDPTRSQPRAAARELRPLREAIAMSRLSCDQMSYKGSETAANIEQATATKFSGWWHLLGRDGTYCLRRAPGGVLTPEDRDRRPVKFSGEAHRCD